MAFAIRRC